MTYIDQLRVRALLSEVDLPNAGNTQKGRALEEAVTLAFAAVPGLEPRFRNALDVFASEELDVVFRNRRDTGGLTELGPELIVECKNWNRRVGSDEVSWVITKLRNRSLGFGILVAANGVTGDRGRRTAALQQLVLARADGIQLVVVTRRELEAMTSGEQLAELIMDKKLALVARGDLYEMPNTGGSPSSGRAPAGWEALERAVDRSWHELAIELHAARPAVADLQQAVKRMRRSLRAVDEEWAAHDDSADPMYEGLRGLLVDFGGAVVCALDFDNWEGWTPEWLVLNARAASGGLQPSPGTELWQQLLGYLIEQIEHEDEMRRSRAVFVLVAMIVAQLIGIDAYSPEIDGDE